MADQSQAKLTNAKDADKTQKMQIQHTKCWQNATCMLRNTSLLRKTQDLFSEPQHFFRKTQDFSEKHTSFLPETKYPFLDIGLSSLNIGFVFLDTSYSFLKNHMLESNKVWKNKSLDKIHSKLTNLIVHNHIQLISIKNHLKNE